MRGKNQAVGDRTAVVCRILKFFSVLSSQLCCRSLANGNCNALKRSGTHFSTVHVTIRLYLGKERGFPALCVTVDFFVLWFVFYGVVLWVFLCLLTCFLFVWFLFWVGFLVVVGFFVLCFLFFFPQNFHSCLNATHVSSFSDLNHDETCMKIK